MEVLVVNRQRGHRVDCVRLERFLRSVGRAMPTAPAGGVSICLVSDRRMTQFNRRFRGREGTTDVLSFPSNGDPEPDGESYLGDILISVTRAAEQARGRGHDLATELEILALHGYLHLLGYDHETDDGTMMRLQHRLERELLGGRRRRVTS